MKPKLLLLHGAVGSKQQLEPLAKTLHVDFDVVSMNFSGHGDQPATENFSVQQFAEEVKFFVEETGAPVNVFGYSMGGYVALYASVVYPHLFHSIITLGTKMYWDQAIAEKEQAMLNADTLAEKAPAFIESLKLLHPANEWKQLLNNTQALMKNLGDTNLLLESNLSACTNNILLMLGDRDKMVSLQETVDLQKKLPNAKLTVLPATPHMIDKVDIDLLSFLIRRHLKAS